MEKPILFNTQMVQAILDGRKTQTRRLVKGLPDNQDGCDLGIIRRDDGSLTGYGFESMPYQPGDILWVQEAWKCVKYDNMDGNLTYGAQFRADEIITYVNFDDYERYEKFGKFAFKNGWQSPYFMPREAARIFLKVTDVKVERLQDITDEDAKAEGIENCYGAWRDYLEDGSWVMGVRYSFSTLWDSTIKKQDLERYGWKTNPWVWVIDFKRIDNAQSK